VHRPRIVGIVSQKRPGSHRSAWRRFICAPIDDPGACGRPAAHAMIGRTRAAIAAYETAGRQDKRIRPE
jgi:hypothetical protein